MTADLYGKLDYTSYLHLDTLFRAQQPLSQPPLLNEYLFITQHQTAELWMKLLVQEIQEAIQFIKKDELEPCFKILSRVKQVQRILFEQWAILETLTPSEYVEFREVLGPASGVQSYNYRSLEFLFGNKEAKLIEVFSHKSEVYASVKLLLEAPSLYDEFLIYLSRKGFDIPSEVTHRNWSLPYQTNSEVISQVLKIYTDPKNHWKEYEMCEKLVDVDEAQALWRFRHMKAVERIIGFKIGTGGTSGVPFLRQVVELRLFPELWDVRTYIPSPTKKL